MHTPVWVEPQTHTTAAGPSQVYDNQVGGLHTLGASEPALVCVIGPPGAGKSSVVRSLATAEHMPVFRLREVIRSRPDLLTALAPSVDPLGWVSLKAVRRMLHAVFVDDGFAFGRSAVLLDNFPGTAAQLELLAETAALTSARVVLLELQTSTHTLMVRVAERRVCLARGRDPHAPAVPASDDPERCADCRTVLARRDTDAPHLHRLRLARYSANLPDIRDCASRHAIPHMSVSGDIEPSKVCDAARDSLHNLMKATHPRGSRP